MGAARDGRSQVSCDKIAFGADTERVCPSHIITSTRRARLVQAIKLIYGQHENRYGPQATLRSAFSLMEWSRQPGVEEAWAKLSQQHGLVLNPFQDGYRARIFSLADSTLIGETPMTLSVRKARQYGFFGTVDSYHSIFSAFHEMGRLKLIVPPVMNSYVA